MLQSNVAEGVRRRTEYKSWNSKVKELVKERKRRVWLKTERAVQLNKDMLLFWKK